MGKTAFDNTGFQVDFACGALSVG